MSKRILFVIDNLGSGGAQNQMTLLASLLSQQSYNIEFFTYHTGDFFKFRLDALAITIHSIPKTTKVGFNVVQKLRRVLKANQFDAIISFLQTPSFYASIAKVLAGNKIPLVISERFISFEKKGTIRYRVKKITHALADFATTNSHHERERLIRKGLTTTDKIKTIYNVVDLIHFEPSTDVKIRNQLLCVASVSSYKNGLCVLEAMNLLKQSDALNFNLSWVGNKVYTIPERAEYIKRMEDKIQDYDLQDHWTWIEPTKDIKSFYHSHDALVHPSYREGLPNVVCESLACGLPVILSHVLDHAILADYPNNGFLFDPAQAQELADRIKSFYEMTETDKNKMRSNCRRFSEKHFSEQRFVDNYTSILQSLTDA